MSAFLRQTIRRGVYDFPLVKGGLICCKKQVTSKRACWMSRFWEYFQLKEFMKYGALYRVEREKASGRKCQC